MTKDFYKKEETNHPPQIPLFCRIFGHNTKMLYPDNPHTNRMILTVCLRKCKYNKRQYY